MKKKSLILAALLAGISCTGLFAQTTTGSLNPGGFYIKGGLNLSNISTNNDGSVDKAKTLSNFNVGIMGDIPLMDALSFQTGLYLTGKGSKTEAYLNSNNKDDNYSKTRFNPLYLELPANLVAKIPISQDARIFIGAGPYVAMGIGGKTKVETKILGTTSTSEENIKFNDDDPTTSQQEGARYDRLKRFDFGLNGTAGIEAGRILLGVNYGYGLTKINSTETNNSANDKNKYRVWSINLGVRL
ncbi:MAG: PorT family protein [Filimonas sp.]|nr:PorT family protein [Filimonas sp.]